MLPYHCGSAKSPITGTNRTLKERVAGDSPVTKCNFNDIDLIENLIEGSEKAIKAACPTFLSNKLQTVSILTNLQI